LTSYNPIVNIPVKSISTFSYIHAYDRDGYGYLVRINVIDTHVSMCKKERKNGTRGYQLYAYTIK